MSPPGGSTATSSAPTQTVPPGESGTPLADYIAAARVLALRGWSESVTVTALDTFRGQGVSGLRRRVSRLSMTQDRTMRTHFAREARQHRPGRRGDIISLRTSPAWPWRVSTG